MPQKTAKIVYSAEGQKNKKSAKFLLTVLGEADII